MPEEITVPLNRHKNIMKAVYFPFTDVPEDILKKISVCFRPLVVLRPSGRNISDDLGKWVESGLVEIRFPQGDDDDQLAAMLKDYRLWANLHKGGQNAYLNRFMDTIPFFSDTSKSQIVKDIKENLQDGGSRNCIDPLFYAKAFLLIAQEFDRQQCEADQTVRLFEEKEHELIKKLQGKDDDAESGPLSDAAPWAENAMNYMIEERLRAWARLFISDIFLKGQEITALFITGSRVTNSYLSDKFPDTERIFEFDSIPIDNLNSNKIESFQQALINTLEKFVKNRWPNSDNVVIKAPAIKNGGKKMALTLDIIPNRSPIDFLSGLYPSGTNEMKEKSIKTEFHHTIIGFIHE